MGKGESKEWEPDLNQQLSFHSKFEVVDEEKKRVSFILSDETIVDRGWFSMQLLHNPENVDLSRANILKVFFNHDNRSLPIGKWENLRVEDKKLKGDALFDPNDEFAMKIFEKIKGGFLESVSVGVSLLKYDLIQRDNQNDLFKVKKWEIFEASIVNIPAIPTAKVGLEKLKKQGEKREMTLEELKKDNPNLFNEVLELGKKEERERLKAINKILNPEFAKRASGENL